MFFTYIGLKQARRNDQLIERGHRERDYRRDAQVAADSFYTERKVSLMPFTIIAEPAPAAAHAKSAARLAPSPAISKKVYFIEPSVCIDCGACGVICPDEAIMNNLGEITHVLKRAERPVADRASRQLQRMRRVRGRMPVRLHLAVAGK